MLVTRKMQKPLKSTKRNPESEHNKMIHKIGLQI